MESRHSAVARKPTFCFAPIPAIQLASTPSRKRTLPAAIGHSHKGAVWNPFQSIPEVLAGDRKIRPRADLAGSSRGAAPAARRYLWIGIPS